MNTSKKKVLTSIVGLMILVTIAYQVSARFADTSPIPAVTAPVPILEPHLVVGEHTALGEEVEMEMVAIEAIEEAKEAEEAKVAEVAEEAEVVDSPYQRYAVVEHHSQAVKDDGSYLHGIESTWRHFFVNADGEWFRIPRAHLEWAEALSEGAVAELPATVLAWVPVAASAVVYSDGELDALSGEYVPYVGQGVIGHDEGIYFFVEK